MRKIQSFLTDAWCIRRADFDSLCGLVTPCIIHGRVAEARRLLEESGVKAAALTHGGTLVTWPDMTDGGELPDGSILTLTLAGTLYAWETRLMSDLLDMAAADERVQGVILRIDGPGGMASGVEMLARKIAGFSKPVATVVEGDMCSAHFWIGSAAGRTFAHTRLGEVGCVGAMTTFVGFKDYYKNLGIDYREIYPESSDLKNKEYRALWDDGDDTGIRERLDTLSRAFGEAVAGYMGVEYDPGLPIFRGDTFSAAEAVRLGYLDQEGDMSDAADWIMVQNINNAFSREQV